MKKLTRALLVLLLGFPVAGMLLSLKAPVPPSSQPSLTPVNCILTIQFQPDPLRTCTMLPNSQADPRLVNGASALSSSQSNTYYCKITVEPMENIYNYNPSTYKTQWTQQGESTNFKVPKEVPSTLIIDFYENCNTCRDASTGRPMFRSRVQLAPGQTHVHALLAYTMKAGC
jgi:hypothetical protein